MSVGPQVGRGPGPAGDGGREAVLPSSVHSFHTLLWSVFTVSRKREGESRAGGWPGCVMVISTQTHCPTSALGLPQLQRRPGSVLCGWVAMQVTLRVFHD